MVEGSFHIDLAQYPGEFETDESSNLYPEDLLHDCSENSAMVSSSCGASALPELSITEDCLNDPGDSSQLENDSSAASSRFRRTPDRTLRAGAGQLVEFWFHADGSTEMRTTENGIVSLSQFGASGGEMRRLIVEPGRVTEITNGTRTTIEECGVNNSDFFYRRTRQFADGRIQTEQPFQGDRGGGPLEVKQWLLNRRWQVER